MPDKVPPVLKAPARRPLQQPAKPPASKTLIVVRLFVALAAVVIAAGVAIYAIQSKTPATAPDESSKKAATSPTPQPTNAPAVMRPALPGPTPAVPALDVTDKCQKWSTAIEDVLVAVKEADVAMSGGLASFAKEGNKALKQERTKLAALDKRIQEAEAATKAAEDRQSEIEEEVRQLVAGQSPVCRLFSALDALVACDAALPVARKAQSDKSASLAEAEAKLSAVPRDRALQSQVANAKKAFDLACKGLSSAQGAVKSAEEECTKAWESIPVDAARTKALFDAGAKLRAAREACGPAATDLTAAEQELPALDGEVLLRTHEADAAAANYGPVKEQFSELKKTAAKIEAQYKDDTGSSRLKNEAIAARKAVDDYKPTHDEALESKQQADKAAKDARAKRDVIARDVAKKQQAVLTAQKLFVTELAAFTSASSTKTLRQEEEAKDKTRAVALAKARERVSIAIGESSKADEIWYDLDVERTGLVDAIAALELAQDQSGPPILSSEGSDALSALQKAISVLSKTRNPTAGDINNVLGAATAADTACETMADDVGLSTFCEAQNMKNLFAQRRAAYASAATAAEGVAWDAAELRDQRVK